MRRAAHRRRGGLGLVICALASFVLVGVTPTSRDAEATSIVAFAPAFSANDNGSIATFGNNLMVCPATVSDCRASRDGLTTKNNNSYNMVHLDVDGAAFPTFSSSTADVVLPPGAEVRWAGLYWGARLGAGRLGVNAIGDGSQMKLRAPGDTGYRTITAGRLFGPTTTADKAYQGFADVTAIVAAAGPGTYTGADVPAATGEDRHSGWSLVVVYRSPSLPLRNLTVFDGLADVGQGDPQSITISGFRTPVTGVVNARIGLVAYEGDRGSTGDRAIFNGTQLATSQSPGTNFFNGTNDDNGTLVTARNPADVNMLGFDIKNFDAPGILGNSATSARIDLASTSERYFPGVVTTAIDVFAPDFSPSTKTVTNLTGGDPARVGDRLRYTVTFVNAGQDPAVDTSIVDPIPPGTSYVANSLVVPSGVTGSFDPGVNAVLVSPGNFPVGRSMTFTFDVDVGALAADTDVANRATITYDGATVPELQNLTFSTAAASIAVVPSADLVVTKVNTPATVVAGGILTSTITVSNGGPSPASDVVVTDELPAGLAATATATQGTCTVAPPLVTCSIGTLSAGATATITVQTPVPPNSTAAALTDVARVTSSTGDPDPDDNTAGATSDVTRNADLSVTKSASPATVTPGGAVTYTITATNNGPSTATAVAIDDTVTDPRVVLTGATSPDGTCTANASSARCTVASLAPGASAVMTVNALTRPGATTGVVANRADVSSATPDAGAGVNEATAQVTVGPAVSDLDVVKTADAPVPLIAGLGEVRYTIDVTNSNGSDANPVTVSDVVPAGFVVVSATTDRGTCAFAPAPTGDTVTCNIGLLLAPFAPDPGASARITIVAEVPAGVAPGTYANVATASAPSAPPTTSPSAPVTVSALANVSIIKSFPQGTTDPEITPGQPKTYRIRVVNDGPSVARNVVVSDSLPAGLTATAWRVMSVTPPGPTPVCVLATVTCAIGDLPPGTSVELELDVLVSGGLVIDPDVGVSNTASVTSDPSVADPNLADNTSTFTASGGAQADLSLRKIPPSPDRAIFPVPAPVAGTNTSYILEIINFGPSDAPNLVTTDLLPPGVSFVRAFEPVDPVGLTYDFCTGDGAEPRETVTCEFFGGSFPPGFAFPAFVGTHLGIEVAIDPTLPDGTVLSNTASITSGADDGNPGNNTSTAVVPVRAEVNLRIVKEVIEMDANGNFLTDPPVPFPEAQDPLGVPPGHAVGFSVTVFNDGPSAAADVRFIDAFPPDAAYFPVGECEFLNRETICPHVDAATGNLLLPGTSYGVFINALPEGDTPPDVYVNTARATTSTDETNLVDNVDTRPIEIIDPIADLSIGKTAVTSPLVAGETFTYQIAVSAGFIDASQGVLRLSSDAANVVVTDSLPLGLTPTSASSSQGTCTVTGQGVSCALGTVGSTVDFFRPAPPALVTITGTVAPNAQSIFGTDVENTARATSSTPLRGGVTDVASTVTTPLTSSADLAVTKTSDSATATAGGGITFTVTVTNTGPSDATGVVLTDLLPAPLEFAPAGSDLGCVLVAGDVVCGVDIVTAGSSRALTIAATLPAGAAPASVVNTATVSSLTPDPDPTDDEAAVDLQVVQAADVAVTKTAAAEGVLLGGTMAYTLTVANQGPSDTTGVVLTESIPAGTTVATLPTGCTGAGPVVCAIGALAAGATTSFELLLAVPDTLPPGPLANTASVTSALGDPDLSDNEAAATVEALAEADVVLTKELVTANPVAGQPLEYLLTVVNNGPTVAPNASLSDPIPTGTTFVSLTATQGTCQLDEVEDVPAASCNLGRLAVGATATATLVVATDPAATSVANTGFAGSGGLDILPATNEDTATTPLAAVADLSVTKAGPAAISAAAPATYVIGYRNDGPSAATDVVITDTLPAGLTPRPATGCTIAGSVVSCAVGTVPVGGTGSVTIVADVAATLAIGTTLTDVAAIASAATDPDPTDDTAQLVSTVEVLNDVGVTVTADQDEVRAGDRASYTVVVTNHGPQLASAVTLVNTLPVQVVVPPAGGAGSSRPLLAQVPPGCLPTGATATCLLGDLAVGATRTVVFGGTVAAGTAAGTNLVDTATVSFDGADALVANNLDSDVIVVVAALAATTTVPGSSGGLPSTGTTVGVLMLVAGVLVLVGSGLRTASADRRRRRPQR